MTRTVADGAASVGALSRAVPAAQREALDLAARRARSELAGIVAARTGGRLRNAGPVGVRLTVTGEEAQIAPTGPLYLLEGPVRPHEEQARSGRALAGGLSHPVRRVRHPGYRARHVWSHATGTVAPTLGTAWSSSLSGDLAAAYRSG
jgi:hypothetical protein